MGPSFDHAASAAVKQLEPLRYSFNAVLATHTSTSAYLGTRSGGGSPALPDLRIFHRNNPLWEEAIIAKGLPHGSRIGLESFFLFEWVPRSPGLYWTPQGKRAREEAQRRIIRAQDGLVVYDPYGKQSMLDGGVGNVRFSPILLNGEEWMLMCASSSGTCHAGFPVAVPIDLYRHLIDEIRARGAAVRSLIGRVKLVPRELSELYSGYTGVPKLYLEVEEAKEPRQPLSRSMEDLEVSVAISFKGKVDEEPGIYASYVTYDPSKPRALEEAVKWMGDQYVGSYDGLVLTDFDEQENHFPEARFSLRKVMRLALTQDDFESVNMELGYLGERVIECQTLIYNINAQNIGVVGDHARVEHVTQKARTQGRTKRSGSSPSKRGRR